MSIETTFITLLGLLTTLVGILVGLIGYVAIKLFKNELNLKISIENKKPENKKTIN